MTWCAWSIQVCGASGGDFRRSSQGETTMVSHRKMGCVFLTPVSNWMATTPGGFVTGIAMIRAGVISGCVAIEHGYGHTGLGATQHLVDGKPMPHDPALGAGVSLNDLGLNDVTRGVVSNAWIDWVSGAVVRQGLPARLERS